MPKRSDALRNTLKRRGTPTEQPIAATEVVASAHYQLSTPTADRDLPDQADQLSESLRTIARYVLAARQARGESLLEEARWMHEARLQAQEGDWHTFLAATATGEDTAERLINVHRLAERHPMFAELVRRGTFSFSVAWRLARPTVPPQVVEAACQSDAVLTVTAINQAIRDAKYVIVDGESPPRGGLSPQAAPVITRPTPMSLAPDVHQQIANLVDRVDAYTDEQAQLSPDDLAVLTQLAQRVQRLQHQQTALALPMQSPAWVPELRATLDTTQRVLHRHRDHLTDLDAATRQRLAAELQALLTTTQATLTELVKD